MTRSVFEMIGDADLVGYLARCSRIRPKLNVEAIARSVRQSILHHKGKAPPSPEGKALADRWYESLERGEPDCGVYDSDFFVGDVWTCWVAYSRGYLRSLRSPRSIPSGAESIATILSRYVGSVADLGCGFGYSTAALKEIFPAARIVGTNLAGTLQYEVASEIGEERGFRVAERVTERADLVFASEYFEHIQNPVEHLDDVIAAGRPRAFVFANAFRARAVGHFDVYLHGGRAVRNTSMGRLFSGHLRANGYSPVKTRLWNNRPALWVKK